MTGELEAKIAEIVLACHDPKNLEGEACINRIACGRYRINCEYQVKQIKALIDQCEATSKEEWYNKGIEEGRSAQAIIEIHGRDIFLKTLKEEQKKSESALRSENEQLKADLLKEITQSKTMVGLLRMAKCPDCDGSGGIPRRVRGNEVVTHDMASDAGMPELEGSLCGREEFELEQCQWCDERKQALAKIDAVLPKGEGDDMH